MGPLSKEGRWMWSRVGYVMILTVLCFVRPVLALELRWANGLSDVRVEHSQRCTLLVEVGEATTVLPESWDLIWSAVADSALVPLGALEDVDPTAVDACEVRIASSTASRAARADTIVFCATDGARVARTARHIFWVVAGSVARIRLILGTETMEVTINGGEAPPLPPLLQGVAVSYSDADPDFIVAGQSLDRVVAASLVQDNSEVIPLAITERTTTRLLLEGEALGLGTRGHLEVRAEEGPVGAFPLSADDLGTDVQWSEDRIIVRFMPGQMEPPAPQNGGAISAFQVQSEGLRTSLAAQGVVRLDRLFPWFRHDDVNGTNPLGEPVTLQDLADVYVATLVPGADVIAASNALEGLPGVKYACPDLETGSYAVPNDPYFFAGPQWGLENSGLPLCQGVSFGSADLGALTAWDRTTGSPAIKIVILDTGIDTSHPDLAFPTALLDTSFVPSEGSANDIALSRHGTAVAGIAGGRGDNSFGISGTAWTVTPVAVKIFDLNGGGQVSWMLNGIDRARIKGYPVCNISGGFPAQPNDPPPSAANIKLAADVCYNAYIAGVLVVAASGNTGLGVDQADDFADPFYAAYPAAFRQRVLTVGAMGPSGARWRDRHFFAPYCASQPAACRASNYGPPSNPWLDLLAPGGRFIVTARNGSGADTFYHLRNCNLANATGTGFGGTSAAAPFAAGLAALLKSYGLSLSPPVLLTNDDCEAIMRRTAVYLGTDPGAKFDRWNGSGYIHATLALNAIAPPKIVVQNNLSLGKPLASLAAVDSVFIPTRRFFDVPGMPAGEYVTSCWRVRLTGTAMHKGFTSMPAVWVRPSGTVGWRDTTYFDNYYEVPWARVVTIGTDQSSFETYVYRIPIGGGEQYFPSAPQQASVAFTAVGQPRTTAVDAGDSPTALEISTLPNPTADGVWVTFGLPRSGVLRAKILDIAGRTVAVIADGRRPGGRMRLRWEGRDRGGARCEPGVYWCKAEFEGSSVAKKFVLLGR